MKKALVAVIIVHGIFLTFLLKFNFWLFDSMSRTFTPLSFASLELYGKILSGMGISWWLLRRGINRNFKEAYQHPILYSIITMLCISILGIVTVPIASFAQNMLVKQIVRSSTYEDRADALLSLPPQRQWFTRMQACKRNFPLGQSLNTCSNMNSSGSFQTAYRTMRNSNGYPENNNRA